jgi:glucokinase
MGLTLGIDLGGTKVLAGVIDTKTGKVLGSGKKRSRAEHTSADIVGRLLEAAKIALAESKASKGDIDQIGIGVAGQIDRHAGVVVNAPNIANLRNFRLAEFVKKELGPPVRLYNDVEAGAAGEAAFGSGKGQKDFLVIFVGTGIGGAIYRGGKPHKGATGTAGEIGHTVIDFGGRVCGCGGIGHLEAYASRTAIVRTILSALHSGRASMLEDLAKDANPQDPGGGGIRSGALAAAVAAGDDLTTEMITAGARYLAAGLASAINFYNPSFIVLGGGLIDAVDVFFSVAAEHARQEALATPRREVRIIKAALGDIAGIVGAAALAAHKA